VIPPHPPMIDHPQADHDHAARQAERQAQERATRIMYAVIDANPDWSLHDLAHAYALADHSGHPDPAVLAALTYLARQTQGRPERRW
jgi:hypothetical protein